MGHLINNFTDFLITKMTYLFWLKDWTILQQVTSEIFVDKSSPGHLDPNHDSFN